MENKEIMARIIREIQRQNRLIALLLATKLIYPYWDVIKDEDKVDKLVELSKNILDKIKN